jgi:PTH1 family peptidyl-tRNA hydrolase
VSSPLRLLIGLGNPGGRYALTRHNAGSSFVQAAARRFGAALREEPKFEGRIASARVGSASVWLFVPSAFMNVCGRPAAKVARFYKITTNEILVAHDDLELPPGGVRLKFGGGHGGHNGLRDLIRHLGGRDFVRLRIGIGRPDDADRVADYVLHKPAGDEARLIDDAVDDALRELPGIVDGVEGALSA